MIKFRIEQIAMCPTDPTKARELLQDLGLTDWFRDDVHASGTVFGVPGDNHALLQFNYQAGNGTDDSAPVSVKPLEVELLHYTDGRNWMDRAPNTMSHLGMHCSASRLEEFRAYFYSKGIDIAQEVFTQGHTNPAIRDSRRYNYVIFNTRPILGVDLKFIVRLPYGAEPGDTEPEVRTTKIDVAEVRKGIQDSQTKSTKARKAK